MAGSTEDSDLHDEEYDEDADEDFNPDAAAADEDVSSSSEDDKASVKTTRKSKKRKIENVVELDSGDEATIQERQRKRKKKSKADEDDAEESGGEGSFVRTRAQRLAEKAERKQRRKHTDGDVTIDVDELWAELNTIPVGRPPPAPAMPTDALDVHGEQNKENAPTTALEGDAIIKRRIKYAGEVTEVEETMPRDSKEAQAYLRDHPEFDANHAPNDPEKEGLARPLKRPSMFEPNPTAAVKGVPPERLRPRAPSRLDVLIAEKRAEDERRKKAERMTTVQKSALDWKGYVDREGLRDELDEYGKGKQGYLAREAFLDRAQGARDEAARAARAMG